VLVASESPHARFCFKKRKKILSDPYPSMTLRGMVPPLDLAEATVHLAVEVFNTVGCFQAPAQLVE